jgi:hypothetical protein
MRRLADVLFFVALAVLAWSGLRWLMDSYQPERHHGVLVAPFPERPPDVVQSEDAKYQQRRALEIVDGFFEEETRRFRGIRFSVDQAEPIARELGELVTSLLDDDRGRFIAGSPKQLAQLLDIIASKPPTAAELRLLERDADLLVSDVRRAYQNPFDTRFPPSELTRRLQDMLAEAESRHRLVGGSLATLRFVVEQARIDRQKSSLSLRALLATSEIRQRLAVPGIPPGGGDRSRPRRDE